MAINCKTCGQPLLTQESIARVREWGEAARKLTAQQRKDLRLMLNAKLRDPAAPGFTLDAIAKRVGCTTRTVSRELRWLRAELAAKK